MGAAGSAHGVSNVTTRGFWKCSSVVGITAAATLRQVQKHTSAKVVKRLCRKIKVGAP